MKRFAILISIFAVLVGASTQRADDLPKRHSFDRYSAMLSKSPFAVATAVAVPAATPSVFKDLYVANAAKAANEDLVTLQSTADKNLKEYLSTKAPNDHGYAIANIEWSDKVGATKVTISKDGQFATLTFNQALLAQAPNPGQAPAAIPTPMPGNVPRAAAVPGVPTPPPHVRGVIPRNPNAPAPTPNMVQPAPDE